MKLRLSCWTLVLTTFVATFLSQNRPVARWHVSTPASADAAPSRAATIAAQVKSLLAAQQADWNRGDIAGFMRGYWQSPQLVFYSGDQEIDGWQAAYDRYTRTYGSDREHMGRLAFSQLSVVPLGSSGAVCWGHWRLQLAAGKTKSGLFTLVLRRFAEGWRIIHDHTS